MDRVSFKSFHSKLEGYINESYELIHTDIPKITTYTDENQPFLIPETKYVEGAVNEFKNRVIDWIDCCANYLSSIGIHKLDVIAIKFRRIEYNIYESDELKILRLKEIVNAKKRLLTQLLIDDELIFKSQEKKQMKPESSETVFIVHGHDNLIKEKVARLIKSLGLDPVILHERPNKGRTIIEKFEQETRPSGVAIILMTADDTGKSNDDRLFEARTRQNVILEMGFFIGKLGRDRVIVLKEENVEIPSDIFGIVYEKIDSSDVWKYRIVDELKSMGYKVSKDDVY